MPDLVGIDSGIFQNCLKPSFCCGGTPQSFFKPKSVFPEMLDMVIFKRSVFIENSIIGLERFPGSLRLTEPVNFFAGLKPKTPVELERERKERDARMDIWGPHVT